VDKKKFGIYIKEKRNELGLTQKELSDKLLIDVSAVSKWERGVSYPDITMIPDICKVLNVSEHELIESSNDTQYRKMKSQAKKYNKITNAVFYSLSACYLVALVTCFIVNLCVSKTLSWFFVVASSLLCGFCFVPSVLKFFEKYKFTIYVVTTFLSTALMYLTISIYTKNYWCFMAIVGTALFYVALFYPFMFHIQKSYLGEEKYKNIKKYFLLSYTILLFLLCETLMFCINYYTKINFVMATRITAYCFLILLIYSLFELSPIKRSIKLGFDFIFTGEFFFGLNGVLNFFLGTEFDEIKDYYIIDFSNWDKYSNGNVMIITVVAFALLGISLILFGLFSRKNKKDSSN